jgi:(p)ppGpp synthase/HD superfamily hydrolase
VVITPHTRLGPRFVEAVDWVTALHAGQARNGGSDVPFVSHLLAVAALTLEDGGDETDVLIALCHDTVEDQGGDTALAEVRRRFGAEVADAVAVLSDSRGEPRAPWRERKERLLAQLGGAEATERVLRVAAADKLHNARTLLVALDHEGPRAWAHREAAPQDYVWFYRSVGTVLAERYPGSANGAELDRVVAELATWVLTGQLARPA